MPHIHPHTPRLRPVYATPSRRAVEPSRACSRVFMDLMMTYGGWIDATDEYDYGTAATILSQFRNDATALLEGDEREAALVFANVFSASIAYWRDQEIKVPLRVSKADAAATLVYTHLRPNTHPEKSVLFGSIVRLLTSVR